MYERLHLNFSHPGTGHADYTCAAVTAYLDIGTLVISLCYRRYEFIYGQVHHYIHIQRLGKIREFYNE